MLLYKVASNIQKKLSLASNANLANLKSVYLASLALAKTKPLWQASDAAYDKNDPYADEPISTTVDEVRNTATAAYTQVMRDGMVPGGKFGYAAFLNTLDSLCEKLSSWHGVKPLDPAASAALSALKSAVQKAHSEFTPIGIPAQNVQTLPETTIVGDKPTESEGAAYEQELNYTPVGKNHSGTFR